MSKSDTLAQPPLDTQSSDALDGTLDTQHKRLDTQRIRKASSLALDQAAADTHSKLDTHTDTHFPLPRYLSVKQLAELLHINEKKVYQLAGEGEIPCTKVTGKWIFPTQLVENWIFENSHGGAMTDRLIVTGSEDILVQRVATRTALQLQESAMISYSPCGTLHGLRMLETGRADACFIQWGATEKKALRHLGLVRGFRNHKNWVIVRVFDRQQGLILAQNIRAATNEVEDLLRNNQIRWVMRGDSAGSTRILQDECKSRHLNANRLNVISKVDSERSALAELNLGKADIMCGAEAVAREHSLGFLALSDVSIDLVMTRQTYFRRLIQAFLSEFRSSATQADLDVLGSYKLHNEFQILTTT